MDAKRYHPMLAALHWLLAFLLIGLLAVGTLALKQVPNASAEKLSLLRVHMVMGASVLVLMLVRLVARLTTENPPAAKTGNPFLDALAPWVHWALYALVFIMAGSGIGMAALTGLPEILFGARGNLPVNFNALPQRAVHGIVAKLLILTITLHAAAALYHHFVKRDGLMAGMWFGSRRGKQ
jgi:cytochrome b561